MVGARDFTAQLREEIEGAGAFVLMIGRYWHSDEAKSRLADTKDILRREVAWALRNRVPIVPVLVEESGMPDVSLFPEELRQVPVLHAERLRGDEFESCVGKLESTLVRAITARQMEQRALAEESDEAAKLPDAAWDQKMEQLLAETRREFQKYLPAKSRRGEGIRDGEAELYGLWECAATTKAGTSSFRFLLEDRAGSAFSGEWTEPGRDGTPGRRHRIRGDWAQVRDVDAGLLLGLYLDFVADGNRRMKLTIPFHEWVADQIVGEDDEGTQYVSRNVEPRTKGF